MNTSNTVLKTRFPVREGLSTEFDYKYIFFLNFNIIQASSEASRPLYASNTHIYTKTMSLYYRTTKGNK